MTYTLKKFGIAVLGAMTALASFSFAAPAFADEDTFDIGFRGTLIELSATSLPTTVVIREYDYEGSEIVGQTDYTVNVTEETLLGSNTFNASPLDAWIPGDIITVQGSYTGDIVTEVDASYMVNATLNPANFRGANGWIEAIDEEAGTVDIQWNGEITTFNVTDNTRMVVPPVNPAALSDFEIGDRVRGRVVRDSDIENELRILLILRRGPKIYNLARTRGFHATIDNLDIDDQEMNVTLTFDNPHLAADDVNNLIGVEGDSLTVTWDDNTTFLRRFFGETEAEEFSEGDTVRIVGGVQDDGTIEARTVKNNSIFRKGVRHHLGEIVETESDDGNYIVESSKGVKWTLEWDDETTVLRGGEEIEMSDLERGEFVTVRGTANSQTNEIDVDLVRVRNLTDERIERHEARIIEIFEEVEDYFEDEESDEDEGREIDVYEDDDRDE